MKKHSRTFKIVIIGLILFLAWLFIAPFLAERLIVEKPLEKADAILILGGSAAFVERTQKAAELYKQGISQKILLTDDGEQGGWNKKEQRNPYFVEKARWELISQGVPAEAIEILEPRVTGTIYEAEVLRKKVEENKLKSVLLVTSAYHTRRTLWTFERVLTSCNVEIGIASAGIGDQSPPSFTWWLKPKGWNVVGAEYVKTVYYWLYY